MTSPLRLAGFLGLAAVVGLPVARATTWVLLNGDRLTGEMISENSRTITVVHPALGRLTLERSALRAEMNGTGKGNATETKGRGLQWKRSVEFGFSAEAGPRSQRNLSARVQLEGKDGDDTYLIAGRFTQAEADGLVSADERMMSGRWRHQLNPTVFAQSLTTWSAEPVRSLDQSVEQQVGAGVRLTREGPTTANAGLGAAVRYQDRDGAGTGTSVLGTIFQDFAHAFAGGIRFSEEASVALASDRPYSPAGGVVGAPPVPADGGNYRVRFNTLLSGKVTKEVTFNVRYDFDYDRSVPDPNGRVDRRVTTSLGYAW